ncbi:MAG: hypothetical protein ABJO54_07370 [Hyphomicrobiales bacterium]
MENTAKGVKIASPSNPPWYNSELNQEVLGAYNHIVFGMIDNQRVNIITDLPKPTYIEQWTSVLGMVIFGRIVFASLAATLAPSV